MCGLSCSKFFFFKLEKLHEKCARRLPESAFDVMWTSCIIWKPTFLNFHLFSFFLRRKWTKLNKNAIQQPYQSCLISCLSKSTPIVNLWLLYSIILTARQKHTHKMNAKRKEKICDRLVENVRKSGFWFQYLLFALQWPVNGEPTISTETNKTWKFVATKSKINTKFKTIRCISHVLSFSVESEFRRDFHAKNTAKTARSAKLSLDFVLRRVVFVSPAATNTQINSTENLSPNFSIWRIVEQVLSAFVY